jgi:hypothetical protein
VNAAAEGIDIERGKENLQRILGGPVIPHPSEWEGTDARPDAAERMIAPKKPRSDKGSKRPAKPEPAKAGVLTVEQIAHIDKLVAVMMARRDDARNAEQASLDANSAYYLYLEELKAQ